MIVQRKLRNSDLAPGDLRSHTFDWTGFQFIQVTAPNDPDFERLYDFLNADFGPKNEMETREVLRKRLGWAGKVQLEGKRFAYSMLGLEKDGKIAAGRDHTVVLTPSPSPRACVHLSHVLVDPQWRRTGLAGWLRAFPVHDARSLCLQSDLPATTPITLVAEMEPFDRPDQYARLKAYSRAGFRRADPDKVPYFQPDFRPPGEIDASGGLQPLPFWLMIRQVGNENDTAVTGLEVRRIVDALYAMYASGFREQDMAPLYQKLENDYPSPHEEIALELIDLDQLKKFR
ncbi:MAG TPA: GNAT family N-acetyltransferase [Chthoniobacterales bacterium]